MDNELEIVTEVANEAEAVVEKPDMLKTAAPIAGAFVVGGIVGWALTKWVITPMLAKRKAKKEAEAAEKAEESSEE